MAWQTGVQVVKKIWPMTEPGYERGTVPEKFLDELIALFVKYGTDAEQLIEVAPRIRESIKRLGIDLMTIPLDDDAVNGCLKGMRDQSAKVRSTSADALSHFVPKSKHPARAAHYAYASLLVVLRDDPSPNVRRVAAETMYSLCSDYPLPKQVVAALDKLPEDDDPVVEKRLMAIMKRAEKVGEPEESEEEE
jgi:hypothetical protein